MVSDDDEEQQSLARLCDATVPGVPTMSRRERRRAARQSKKKRRPGEELGRQQRDDRRSCGCRFCPSKCPDTLPGCMHAMCDSCVFFSARAAYAGTVEDALRFTFRCAVCSVRYDVGTADMKRLMGMFRPISHTHSFDASATYGETNGDCFVVSHVPCQVGCYTCTGSSLTWKRMAQAKAMSDWSREEGSVSTSHSFVLAEKLSSAGKGDCISNSSSSSSFGAASSPDVSEEELFGDSSDPDATRIVVCSVTLAETLRSAVVSTAAATCPPLSLADSEEEKEEIYEDEPSSHDDRRRLCGFLNSLD